MKRPIGLWLVWLAVHATARATATEADFVALERTYLACNQAAMRGALSFGDAAACSQVYERLLAQRFGGNFERLLQWSRSADAADAAGHTPFETGQAHFAAGRYAEAYRLFARLADCGHREAARMAMQMFFAGPDRYETVFAASPQQLERWHAVLAAPPTRQHDRCAAS